MKIKTAGIKQYYVPKVYVTGYLSEDSGAYEFKTIL